MKLREALRNIFTLIALMATQPGFGAIAESQQQAKVAKIGYIGVRPPFSAGSVYEDVRRALHEIGYVEGENIVFEYRSTDNKPDRLPALADELVRLKVDLIFTPSTTETLAARNATKTIPIVFISGDPIGAGLIDSLARPGGNIAGFTTITSLLAGKRLELLKETVPKLSRVAVLWDPRAQGAGQSWKESQLPARELGLQLHSMEVRSADQFEGAFKEAIKAGSAALAVATTPFSMIIKNRSRTLRQKIAFRQCTLAQSSSTKEA